MGLTKKRKVRLKVSPPTATIFSSLPEGFITLVVAPKKCTAQIALGELGLTNNNYYYIVTI
jgi:hypothetical protein